jgi:hypothetical protein
LGHLCGLCLALRDEHGHLARLVTNHDGLLVSVLVDAQQPGPAARRRAGPCLLRGMRGADVAVGAGARLAAVVSLALAAVRTHDHVADRDGPFAHRPVAAAARHTAACWMKRATRTGLAIGFDTTALLDAAVLQRALESAIGPGDPLHAATGPTEGAVAAAFAHTAVLAGRPGNVQPLREAGRQFGRIAHLLDAVADLREDGRSGAWNPILATGAGVDGARRLCDDALADLRLALRPVDVSDGRLLHALLAHETGHAVHRTFTAAPPGGPPGPPPPHAPPLSPPPPQGVDLGPIGQAGPPPRPRRRGGCDGGPDCCCDGCDGCECCSTCDICPS